MQLKTPLNLKQAFSVSRYIQLRGGVSLPTKPAKRGQWVVSRSLCLYQLFDFAGVPKSKKEESLAIRVRRWSPFAFTGSHIVWHGDFAMVWIWDAGSVQENIAQQDIQVIEVIPETVLLPRAQDAVKSVVSVDGGVDCQIWRDGLLVASKWFLKEPSDRQWSQFVRGLVLPAALKPDLGSLIEELDSIRGEANVAEPLAGRPWGAQKLRFALVKSFNLEPWLVIAGVLLISVLVVWQITAVIIVNNALSTVENRMGVFAGKVDSVLSSREQALRLRDKAEALLKLTDLPDQRALMARVGRVIRAQGAELKEWHYSLGVLEVSVTGEGVKTLPLVKALEQLEICESATLDRGRKKNQHKFIMKLKSLYAG